MHEKLLDNINHGIAIFNEKGEYIYYNSAEIASKNIPKEQIKSMTLYDIFKNHTNELKSIFKSIFENKTQELFFQYEKNEQTYEMKFSKFDNNVYAQTENITKIKVLEENVKEDKENIKRLDDAIKGANIGVWDFFPQEGRILANDTWVTQKKYKPKDFKANDKLFSDVVDGLNKWASIVHPDDLEPTGVLINKHLNGETEYYEAEFRMMCGDGKYRWIYDLGQVFKRDENGMAVRMNGVHIDITKIKNLQEELEKKSIEFEKQQQKAEESIENFEYLFNHTMEAIGLFQNNKCVKLNKAGIKLFGFDCLNDVLGMTIFDFMADDSKETVKEMIKNRVSTPYETQAIKKDGTVFPVLIRGQFKEINGVMTRIATLIDLTELKKLQQIELQYNKQNALYELITNISHQWRQPLSAISTIASGIKTKIEFNVTEENEITEQMDLITGQTQYLSKTIEDFKYLIKDNEQKNTFSITDTIEYTLDILKQDITERNIEIIYQLDEDIKINGFQNQLVQAFINVLKNSYEAIENKIQKNQKKYIFIQSSNQNESFSLSIKDNAGGIEDEIMNQIFDPYFTTKHQSNGTGIGLSTTYQIINHHNGNILAKNETYTHDDKQYTGACFQIGF